MVKLDILNETSTETPMWNVVQINIKLMPPPHTSEYLTKIQHDVWIVCS